MLQTKNTPSRSREVWKYSGGPQLGIREAAVFPRPPDTGRWLSVAPRWTTPAAGNACSSVPSMRAGGMHRHWHRGACTSMGGECATTGVYAPAQGADCFQTATGAPPASPSSKGPPPTLLSQRRNCHVFCRKDPAELPGPPDPRHQGCSGAHHPCSAALLPRGFFKVAFISDFYICYPLPSHTSHQPREPNLLRASPPSAAKVWAVLPKQGGRSRSPNMQS